MTNTRRRRGLKYSVFHQLNHRSRTRWPRMLKTKGIADIIAWWEEHLNEKYVTCFTPPPNEEDAFEYYIGVEADEEDDIEKRFDDMFDGINPQENCYD